jgi:hypothetical protein
MNYCNIGNQEEYHSAKNAAEGVVESSVWTRSRYLGVSPYYNPKLEMKDGPYGVMCFQWHQQGYPGPGMWEEPVIMADLRKRGYELVSPAELERLRRDEEPKGRSGDWGIVVGGDFIREVFEE